MVPRCTRVDCISCPPITFSVERRAGPEVPTAPVSTRGKEHAMLTASANSSTDPDMQPLEHRALRNRNQDDAGPNPAATEASIGRFAELVARAVVAGYRNQQGGHPLGDE